MKWKRGYFNKQVKSRSKEGYVSLKVKGVILKDVFGIETGGVSVIHIPTGLSFGWMDTFTQAKNYAETILNLTDWKVLKDLSDEKLRAELIEIKKTIMED